MKMIKKMFGMLSGCADELKMKIRNQYNNIIDGAF